MNARMILHLQYPSFPPDSHLLQRPEHVSRLPGPAGRRERLGNRTFVRQRRVRQRKRRARRRREATRAPDNHQGQATGNTESGVRSHSETHKAHPGTAVAGNRPEHESDPGKLKRIIKSTLG